VLLGVFSGVWIDGQSFLEDLYTQTDLSVEGTYTTRMRDILDTEVGQGCGIESPRVLYATRDILIMTKQLGSHPEVSTMGHRTMEEISRKSGGFFLYTAVIHGFCHGDTHSGNLLFDPGSGCLSIIDYGSCLTLPTFTKNPIVTMLAGSIGRGETLIRPIFAVFFPWDTFQTELGPPLQAIIDISWESFEPMQRLLVEFATRFSLRIDSNILHFLLQLHKIQDVMCTDFYSTSPYSEAHLLIYEAVRIAEQSISPAKKVHVLFLKSLCDILSCSTPRIRDTENRRKRVRK
jgi:hypothetical protein